MELFMELIITLLELSKHERFNTIGVNFVRYTPQSKTQMIIGSNGSGKSTLLEELTPLPPKSSKFAKGGYKHIELTYNNKKYVLRSEYNESQYHSFIVIDETGKHELNEGHTLSIQKNLVKQIFGITQQTHELSLGIKKFTEMSTEERKSLLTELCEADFTYALKKFQDLKERQRDLVGSIKINQKRAVTEANRMMSETDLKLLQDKQTELTNLINNIMSLKKPVDETLDTIENKIQQLTYQSDKSLLDIIKNIKSVYKNTMFTDDEVAESILLEKQIEVSKKHDEINRLSDELNQLQKGLIDVNDNESLFELESTLQQVILSKINTQTEVDACVRQFLNLDGSYCFDSEKIASIDKDIVKKQLLAIEEAEVGFMEIIHKLPDNSVTQYTREKYNQLSTSLSTLKEELEATIVQHKNTLLEIKLLDKKKEEVLSCPNCNHIYHKDYDDAKHTKLLNLVPILFDKTKEITAKIEELEPTLKNMEEYLAIEDNLYTFFNHHRAGKSLWIYLRDNNIISQRSYELPSYFNYFKTMLQKELEKREWIEKENYYLSTITKVKSLQEEDKQQQKEHYNTLSQQLETITEKYNNLNTEIKEIKQYLSSRKQLTELKQKLLQTHVQHEELVKQQVLQMANMSVSYIVKHLGDELLEIKQQICRYDIQKNIVDNINNTIEELKKEEKIVSALIKGLSPTTGLIAKGLVGFIQRFVQDTNAFIKLIWTKPMEILPPKIDEDSVSLDYRFPVMIKKQIADVSEGSKAMQEIFNLAFMITAMKYKRMGYYPLYLDEFASSMDPKHRDISFSVIENLITKTTFSQVFIVSHVEKFYGSIRTADLSVMCSKNLYLPKDVEFNKYLTIQ